MAPIYHFLKEPLKLQVAESEVQIFLCETILKVLLNGQRV